MLIALRMREVATAEHYWTVSADYANETLAIAAALKDHPGCVVSRCTFPTREQYDAFIAHIAAGIES